MFVLEVGEGKSEGKLSKKKHCCSWEFRDHKNLETKPSCKFYCLKFGVVISEVPIVKIPNPRSALPLCIQRLVLQESTVGQSELAEAAGICCKGGLAYLTL